MTWRRRLRRVALLAGASLLLAAGLACAKNPPLPAAGSMDADKFLYDRGMEELKEKHWFRAREYFRRLVDTFPGSRYRQDAKLGIGDSFLGEGRIESNVLAANEFREFLAFFPLNPRADYAQHKLAVALYRQVLAPQRDQTATHEALKEMDTFLANYPASPIRPDVDKLRQQARDRLAESEFAAGMTYFRSKWWPGAVARFQYLIDTYPEYTRRDRVYYHIGEALLRAGQGKQALPFYERILVEFEKSEYLERARKRVSELKR